MTPPHDRVTIEELLGQSTWLRRLAATLVAGPAAADDLVQETWLAALSHPPRCSGSVRPWLARVARNLARNLRRGERRRAQHEREVELPAPELDPRRIAEEVEAQRVLAEVVLRLEEPLRTTVVLRYFRGHDSGEVGRLLGVPAGTVRWRLKRGLECLREELDRRYQGESPWRALFATFLPAASQVPALPIAAGAALMNVPMKLGIFAVAAVAMAALLGAWVLVVRPGETPDRFEAALGNGPDAVARSGGPANQPEAATASRRLEAGVPAGAAPAEVPLVECCIVGRVVDSAGRGVAGARVSAHAATIEQTVRVHLVRPAPVTSLTGAEGGFSLPVPELRPFVLSAVHPDFAPGTATLAFAGERRDIVLRPGSELRVRVRGGRVAAGAVVRAQVALPDSGAPLWHGEATTDAAGEVLLRGVPAGEASVTASFEQRRAAGRVPTDGQTRARCELELRATGRVEGTVVDRTSQQPIAGARVGIQPEAASTTDGGGRYGIDAIVLGKSTLGVAARARGYAARHEYVVVDEGSARQTVNFELEPAIRASGSVQDRAGRAVAGARVAWTGMLATGAFVGETERGEVVTDARGGFALEGLHPATPYRLLVLAEGYGMGVFACGPFPLATAGSTPAAIGALILDQAGSIAGTVPEARAEAPCFVRLAWAEEDSASQLRELSHLDTARTDPRGRFAFAGCAAGRYHLSLWRSARPDWAEPPLAEEVVTLAAGEARRNVVLGTSHEAITGTVTKESGQPFGRCQVRLLAGASPARELAVAHTDQDGRFRLHARGPGPFRVVAEDPSLMFDTRAVEPVGPHDDLRIVLPVFRSEHSIRGRVITVSGEVPSNVFVAFTDTATRTRLARVAIPEPDGRFTMKNLRAVAYDLESVDFAGGHETARAAGVLPGGAEVELRLKKRP